MKTLLHILDQTEEFLCQLLLVGFTTLLFAQIIARQFFQYSIPWGDELATYMFVWFAYFGSVVAAKLSAHNRVTFQFQFFPPIVKTVCETIADLIWVCFNLYFAYLAYDFIANRMNAFWKSQTIGLPMKYFYMVLPVAFVLMTIRILINNYRRLVLKEVQVDPEQAEIDKLARENAGQQG